MDELIRDRIHSALEVEPVPAYLRHRVISSLPARERGFLQPRSPQLRLAMGGIAAVLAIAIVIGLLFAGGVFHGFGNQTPATHHSPRSVRSPEGIAIGPDGSVYVADYVAGYVFKVLPDATLVVVAGGLHNPGGLAVDRLGNVFVAEALGNRVLRIDGFGKVSTYAGIGPNGFGTGKYAGDGGPATAASLNFPLGLALDQSDNLYIGDIGNNAVRRVDAGTGIISSLTVPVTVPLAYPGYLAFDQGGNLYVASHQPYAYNGECRIVRMSKTGQWSFVAGSDRCGFSGDDGPATSAMLSMLGGVAFDAAGNIYFADSNNSRIRRIDNHGIVTTVAGTGTAGFDGDGQATSKQLGFPFGIAMSQGHLLFIADGSCGCDHPTTPGHIRILNITTGAIATII